jgi:hypothetical protein
VLAQAPDLPLHLLVICPYVIASSTQRRADTLGVLPWHPCPSIHVSDTSSWPLLTLTPGVRKCITHACTGHCMRPPAHTHHWSPARLPTPAPSCCVCVHSTAAAAPKSLRVESVFSTEPSTQCTCVRQRRRAIHLPEHRVGHGRHIAFPCLVHPCQCARSQVDLARTRRICVK